MTWSQLPTPVTRKIRRKTMTGVEIALHYERPIDPQAVRELYTSVDWWPLRTPEEIAQVLKDALAVGAWEEDHLVGLARAVSDQHLRAFIEDVVVQPSHQRRGLGRLLLTKLLDALPQIETITLFCQPDLVAFYEEHGFRAFPSQVVMHRQRIAPCDADSTN
jgi:ribosomal protein S18 acetylase RimI-like enzyme